MLRATSLLTLSLLLGACAESAARTPPGFMEGPACFELPIGRTPDGSPPLACRATAANRDEATFNTDPRSGRAGAEVILVQADKTDWTPYLDFRNAKTQDGVAIGLADIEFIASTESKRLEGVVVVSYADDAKTKTYYRLTQDQREMGAPIVGFIRAPEDDAGSFVAYYDGHAYTDSERFNQPHQLAVVLEHLAKKAGER